MGRIIDPNKTKLINNDCEPVSKINPLPVDDIDGGDREGLNTIFGDRIIGSRVANIASQFQYGIRSDDTDTTIVSTGSINIANAMIYLNTGTASDGSVTVQGKSYLRYLPGHEAFAFFTAVFTTPQVDSVQRIGLFDYDSGNGNGFFVGYEGTQFGVTRRRAGVDYFQAVDVNDVFPEDSGTFDPTKGNIYKISYGYLGFATIHFAVVKPGGGFAELAKIEYPNAYTETHIANTNLPFRAEMTNSGNTTDLELRVGSVNAGVVDGGGGDPNARIFSQDLGTIALPATTQYQIAHFRNKSTFYGITNKIVSQLILISSVAEGNKPVLFGLKKNATIISAGTWNDANTDSVIEYSTDAVVNLTTGEDMLFWNLGKSGSFFEDVEALLVKLRDTEWATFYAYSASTSDINLSIRWKDLF